MREEALYYSYLNKDAKQVYHALKSGLQSLLPSFAVPTADMQQLSEIFFFLRLDCPEIFYVSDFSCRRFPGAEGLEFVPVYLFPKKQILEKQKALEARVTRLLRPAQSLNAAEKQQFVHDFICRNVRYDKLKKPYSHEILGPLEQGVGVCEGISKTVKLLCGRLGLPCIIALSGNNPEKGIRYRHVWNMVCRDGQYYHMDVTFDNSLSREDCIRYDYYNINDAQLFRDHEPVLVPVPACGDGRHSWYSEKKLAFGDYDKLRGRIAQNAKKRRTFVFRWNGGYLTRDVIHAILLLICEEAERAGCRAGLSMNPPQAVFHVSFSDDLSLETELKTEQANEGELYNE